MRRAESLLESLEILGFPWYEGGSFIPASIYMKEGVDLKRHLNYSIGMGDFSKEQ